MNEVTTVRLRTATMASVWRLVRPVIALLVRTRVTLLIVLTVGLAAWMTLGYPNQFPTSYNLEAIAVNAAISGIMVCGMTLLLVGGAFDLSIGGILTFTGVITASLIANHGMPIPLAIFIGLLAGAGCGFINGILVTKVGINALITTLATGGIFYGVTELVNGSGVVPISNSFGAFGEWTFLGLQTPFWFMVGVVILMWFAVSRTSYFRQFYFVGGNERAARFSGIRSHRVLLVGFMLMGVLAALGGVLLSARLNAATPLAGTGTELSVITAAVLGGASLKGGEGNVIGGVLGVFFIALVQNTLVVVGVDPYWQQIVTGAVLLGAVSLDRAKGVFDMH
jgi:ribose/xylose/arabinose/galactoside ABC-type transport system permease subunit